MKEIYKVVKDLLINVEESDYDNELLASNYGEPLTSYYTMKCKAGDYIFVEDSNIFQVIKPESYFRNYPYDDGMMWTSKTYHLHADVDKNAFNEYVEPSNEDAVNQAVNEQIKLAEAKQEVEHQIETVDMGVYEIKHILKDNHISKDNLPSLLKSITDDANIIVSHDENANYYFIKMIPDLKFITTNEDVLLSIQDQKPIKTSDPKIINEIDQFLKERMDNLTNELNKIESLAGNHEQAHSKESAKEDLEIDL